MRKELFLISFIIFSSPSLYAQWQTGGTGIYYSAGNVGIGTSTPSQPLTVNGAGLFYRSGSSGVIQLQSSTQYAWNIYNGSSGTNDFSIQENSASGGPHRFVIQNTTGYVGIGTVSPTNTLHVIGNISANNSSSATSNSVAINAGNTTTTASANVNRIRYGGNDANSTYFTIQGPSNVDYLTINNGNVGIGTTTPTAKLTVAGHTRILNGSDIYLQAPTSSANDAGDIVFSNSTGTEMARIYTDPSGSGSISFSTVNPTFPKMMLTNNGNLLIGKTTQTNTAYKLDVNGNIRANKVVVNTTGADFVFDPSYKLMPLKKLELFLQQNHHLPGVEPAAEMQKNGVDLGVNQTVLLQKTEELTLYIIEQDKKLAEQTNNIIDQDNKLTDQNNKIEEQNKLITDQQLLLKQLQQELQKQKAEIAALKAAAGK